MAFLDLSKAYDIVGREGLWMKMRKCRVQKECVNVCKSLYEGVEARVLLGGECSRRFDVVAELRQDCLCNQFSIGYM